MSNRTNISYLQQDNTQEASENSGSILDGQNIVFDPHAAAYPQNENSDSPRAALDASGNEIDDRYEHMLDVENNQEEVAPESQQDVVTETVLSNGEPIPEEVIPSPPITVTFTTTDTTTQVAQSENNYRIHEFDSSVKHAVYPSPETDKMISWGVLFICCFLASVFALKFIINLFKNNFFSIRQYKMKAVYALLRDLAVFIFILFIILSLHFHSYLDFFHTNIENIFYGIYIFTVLWIFSSMVLFYTCYIRLEKFYNYESISKSK